MPTENFVRKDGSIVTQNEIQERALDLKKNIDILIKKECEFFNDAVKPYKIVKLYTDALRWESGARDLAAYIRNKMVDLFNLYH